MIGPRAGHRACPSKDAVAADRDAAKVGRWTNVAAHWRGVAAQSEVLAKPRRTHGTSLISAEPRILQTDVDWRSAAAARWPEDALYAEIADELDAGEANDAMCLD